jgi:DNA-binding CsgD family transcriptional regulator/tetratricopeptide (TPR) repeat protein
MTELVERTGALDRVRRLVERARTGSGGLLVLEGEAGIGKTSLLREAARHAHDHGFEVARATGHPIETALAFGVVRQLLEPLLATRSAQERARLAAGPARAVVAMLDGAPAAGADELELVHAAYRLVGELARAGGSPLVLVVDDLQWGDRSSVMFLLYLAQRLGGLPLVLLASVRRGEPAEAGELLGRLLAEARHGATTLQPLSPAACAELVRRRFPDARDAFCRECARVTGGNPFLLGELLDAVASSGAGTDDAAASALQETSSVSLQRSTSLRLRATGAAGRSLAEAVAVLEPGAPLRRVAALADLPPEEAAAAADALVRVGLLQSSAPPTFAHPLILATVRSTIPDAERGLRHRRAAALASDEGAAPEQVAAHLIWSTPAGDGDAVACLRAAARAARSRGAAASACRYLQRALEEPPSRNVRAHVLAELAEAELLAGRFSALERLDEALDAAVDPETETAVLTRTGDLLFQSGKYDEAALVFDRALRHQSGGDPELRARLRVCRLAMETLRPGGKVGPDLVDVPDEQLDAGGHFLQAHLALASVMGVTDHEQTARLARAALADGAILREQGIGLDLMVALGCLVWSDQFDECDEEVARGLAVADRQASHLGRANLLFGRAWSRYWSGHLQESVEDSLAAIEPWRGGWNGQIHFARFWCAVALVELDRLDEAQAVVDEPDSPGHGADAVGVATIEVARGRVATARGDHRAAREHLEKAAAVSVSLPFLFNPTVLPWRSEAALAHHAVGEVAQARALVSDEVRLARTYGAARPLGVALRAQGLVVGGEEGLELLGEAVEVLSRSPARLEEVRARIDLGAALRRTGRRSDARELLRDGLDAATRMGATRLRDRARAELAAAGGRPRREAVTGPEALTPSERRVCELAAAGRSNPQIAAELFLSRRTVEFHLRGAFHKLEVTSRHELPGVLHSRPETGSPTG